MGRKCRSSNTRGLWKHQLGGVIFGTTITTINECLSKKLFGLPSPHFEYVKKIEPGLQLFLFNYTDRTLLGIFEAASSGQMNIDPYAWTCDGSHGRTPFPAQVEIRVRLQCKALTENEFKPMIVENYYKSNQFCFELDYAQTNRLLSSLTSHAFSCPPPTLTLLHTTTTTTSQPTFSPTHLNNTNTSSPNKSNANTDKDTINSHINLKLLKHKLMGQRPTLAQHYMHPKLLSRTPLPLPESDHVVGYNYKDVEYEPTVIVVNNNMVDKKKGTNQNPLRCYQVASQLIREVEELFTSKASINHLEGKITFVKQDLVWFSIPS